MEVDSVIYDPLEQFNQSFKMEHAKHVSDYFEELVASSGVNEEQNARIVKSIRKHEDEITRVKKRIGKSQKVKKILIYLIVIFFLTSAVFIFSLVKEHIFINLIADILIASLSLIIGVSGIVLIVKKSNKIILHMENYLNELKNQLKELTDLAWAQMRPLNILYDWDIPNKLVEKTVPIFKFDSFFDSNRYKLLHGKYNLVGNEDRYYSVLNAQSGEIVGNPFVFGKKLHHYMGERTYSGSLKIYWTEYVRDSEGNLKTEEKSETLYASIARPYPNYEVDSFVVYGNDAAPNLSFTRKPSDISTFDEKKINKLVKKKSKDIQKKVKKAIIKGENFTAMSDTEFDVLFNALDRDNEVEFRLLFTPLAQRQMTKLIKDKNIGFGDNFEFHKMKALNILFPKHLGKADINTHPNRFLTYELAKARKLFNDYNNEYFKNVYFSFTPILAIPLYQQYRQEDTSYQQRNESNISCWEHEAVVNNLDDNFLNHSSSVTSNIHKTELINSMDGADELLVTSYGYQAFEEVDYVEVKGGDGNYHSVPVVWYRYVPVKNESIVVIKVAKELEQKNYIDNIYGNQQWKNFFGSRAVSLDAVLFRKNMIAYVSNKRLSEDDNSKLNNLLNDL